MILPNCKNAFVAIEKVTDYLLNLAHPHGKPKAMFFTGIGYSTDTPQHLQQDLAVLGCKGKVVNQQEVTDGIKYTVVGTLVAPNGKPYLIKTIWIREHLTDRPRLITAYPN